MNTVVFCGVFTLALETMKTKSRWYSTMTWAKPTDGKHHWEKSTPMSGCQHPHERWGAGHRSTYHGTWWLMSLGMFSSDLYGFQKPFSLYSFYYWEWEKNVILGLEKVLAYKRTASESQLLRAASEMEETEKIQYCFLSEWSECITVVSEKDWEQGVLFCI